MYFVFKDFKEKNYRHIFKCFPVLFDIPVVPIPQRPPEIKTVRTPRDVAHIQPHGMCWIVLFWYVWQIWDLALWFYSPDKVLLPNYTQSQYGIWLFFFQKTTIYFPRFVVNDGILWKNLSLGEVVSSKVSTPAAPAASQKSIQDLASWICDARFAQDLACYFWFFSLQNTSSCIYCYGFISSFLGANAKSDSTWLALS